MTRPQVAPRPAPPVPAAVAPGRTLPRQQVPIRIFQIYYDDQQIPLLDPAFDAFDNCGNDHPLREFDVFRKIVNTPAARQARLWGAVSWKFQEKVGIPGIELINLIDRNPGYDLYYCNPFPDTEALYPNFWMQGETSHPNFLLLCNEFFQAADLPTGILAEIQPAIAFASTNTFVASQAFWAAYMAFIEGLLAKADQRLSPIARKMLYSDAADQRGIHVRACYIPHIVERLLTVFLQLEGKHFKALKFPVAGSQSLNTHVRLLREMKDVAHRTRSAWMASCWLNYRNLLLADIHDPAWVKKYLPAISPKTVQFSDFPPAPLPKGAMA